MYTKRQKVNIDDTRFIFTTNFSGDPSRDRFGSDKRRVNVVIPTMELVNHLMDLGVKVRQTNPNPERTYDEPFVPTYFVPVTINMDSKWPRISTGSPLPASACSATWTRSVNWTLSGSRTSVSRQTLSRSGTHPANTACMRM